MQVESISQDINPDGSYNYAYALSDGQKVAEQGTGGVKADGSFSYVSPEGQNIQLNYVADENGFQPTGDHLPTPPPIPEAIIRALEWIKTHPAPETK